MAQDSSGSTRDVCGIALKMRTESIAGVGRSRSYKCRASTLSSGRTYNSHLEGGDPYHELVHCTGPFINNVQDEIMVAPNSTRKEDWSRFGQALLLVLHTGKNIVVEEARRWGVELRPSKW